MRQLLRCLKIQSDIHNVQCNFSKAALITLFIKVHRVTLYCIIVKINLVQRSRDYTYKST
jgi:hypothetical protein